MKPKGNLFSKLLLMFTIVPLIELFLLFQIARVTNWVVTFGLVLVTGVTGAYLAKREGRDVMGRIRKELMEGRMPGEELLSGLCVVVGGALLLTPGIITDLFGFTLILPFTRRFYKKHLAKRFKASLQNAATTGIYFGSMKQEEPEKFRDGS